jgi:transposase
LVRAREDVRVDLMRARHRLSKVLLRRELYHPGSGNAWTAQHREWLDSLRFDDGASQVVFTDYLEAQDRLRTRRDRLERELEALASESPWARTIANLRALRGIDTRRQPASAPRSASSVASTPSSSPAISDSSPARRTTGEQRRQGSITKAGSRHARRLLREAAWHYRNRPYVSEKLRRRRRRCDPRAVQIAWQAQRRLHRRWGHLARRRGKRENQGRRSPSPASCRPSAGRSRSSTEHNPVVASGRARAAE